jgi:hypothetical protein
LGNNPLLALELSTAFQRCRDAFQADCLKVQRRSRIFGTIGTRGLTLTLKLKFADLELITQSRTLGGAADSHSELESASTELLSALYPMEKAVRPLGVSISGFSVGGNERTEQIRLLRLKRHRVQVRFAPNGRSGALTEYGHRARGVTERNRADYLGREPINLPGGPLAKVRYAPIANQIPQRSEMTRWAINGLTYLSKGCAVAPLFHRRARARTQAIEGFPWPS